MKSTMWIVSAVFVALVLSGAAYAHDGDNGPQNWQGQKKEWHHQGPHLSKEKLKAFHDAMKAVHEKDQPLFEQAKQLHKQLKDVVKAETFDAKAYLDLKTQIRGIMETVKKDHDEAFASIAGQFTPKERKALLHMMRKHHHDWHHKHHMKDHAWGHDHENSMRFENGGNYQPHPVEGTDNSGYTSNIGTAVQPVVPNRDYPPYSPR